MLLIQNKGQAIASTNYWDSEIATAGLVFLSWNAGAARLLIPDSQKAFVREMRSAKEVIVSRGQWSTEQGPRDALELLFEDGTDAPFVIHIVSEQTDRMIPEHQQGGGFVVSAWTRGGMKQRWPGRYRVVEALPCLAHWSEH
jgi:hypothetical protein